MPNPSRDSCRPVPAGPAHQSLQPQTAPNAVAAATHPPTGAAETRSADPRRENCSSPTAWCPNHSILPHYAHLDPKSDRLLVSMARGWPVLIQDSEDGVIGCYPLAVREGRCSAEADVRSSPRRDTDVLLDDGCTTFDG